MTWNVWHVSPFITGIFFILGVFTLHQVSYDSLKSFFDTRKIKYNETRFNSWYGVSYMLIFIFSMQATLVGTSIAWQFMNFQLLALIFCAYFLNIHVPYKYFIPIIVFYMIVNGTVGYWQSWCHGITLMMFYQSMNHYRRHNTSDHPFFSYLGMVFSFGFLLWFFVKIKFNLTWTTFWEEFFYLLIFEVLLYSYVSMILRESSLKFNLVKLANHDALTNVENYAAYSSEIKQLFDSSMNNHLHLSMMMFDIDHFKKINDKYGHLAGDAVLEYVVQVAQTVIDENDPNIKLYRTGGEEFNVLFPSYDLKATSSTVQEIFQALNHLSIDYNGQTINLTISAGVSTLESSDKTPTEFYSRADDNLYNSKKNGRMQVTSI